MRVLVGMCAVVALGACASSPPRSNATETTAVDCAAALAQAGNQTLALDGAWRGRAASQDRATSLELQIVEGRAYASFPERAQFDFPVAAALANENVLCVTAPYRRGSWTLNRERRGWRGSWADEAFQAEIELSPLRRADFPRERELNFVSSDGAQLAGTLVLPARGADPFPTIVWVHGSAPTTRATWFYRGRARMLARQGVASLIWDKRGSGASTGERGWHIDNLTLDAQAAIEAARAAPEVADNGVVIAGFSQGGWIAPRVASANPWVAGVLVGAAPGITIAEQNVWSFERALQLENVPADMTARAVGLVRATYEYYRTGQGYAALRASLDDPENAPIVSERFFRNMLFQGGELPPADVDPADWSFMFVDYLDYWRRVDQPVLAMWGADDNEVPPDVSRANIQAALAGHGSSDRVLVILDDATHSLYVDHDDGEPQDWERTAPGFQENIAEWMARRR